MESFYGRELRVKKTALLGMWYSGFGFIGATIYMFFVATDFGRIMRMFGSLFVVTLSLFFLWGVQKLAMALQWSFARVTMDGMGLTVNTLSGSTHIDWMNVASFNFLDKRGAISLTSRTGENLNLTIGMEEFPDVLHAILEKIRENTISTSFNNQFTTQRFNVVNTLLGLIAVVIIVLISLFVIHDKIGLWVGAVGIVGILVWPVVSGLKWVAIEDNMIRIKYVWHTREVAIDDVTGVSMHIKNSGQREQASLVLALDVVTSQKPVEIPFRGQDLLPLYLRLKQVIPSGSSH